MIEWIKTKLIWILCAAMVISWGITGYVIHGKGIHIDKSITTVSTSASYANSSSSSIGININDSRYYGSNERPIYVWKSFKTVDDALVFMNGLPEGSLFNKDMLVADGEIYVVYRTMESTKDKKTGETYVKTVNGKIVESYKK